MNTRLEISIPKSCSENWISMQQAEGGNYCLSCQKTVVDFTAFNQEEIQEWFLQHQNEKVCGRFYSSQLVVQEKYPSKKDKWIMVRTKILAAAVLMFPFTMKASDSLSKKQKIETAAVSGGTLQSKYFDQQTQPGDSIRTIKGVVLDKATKEVLPGVIIKIKNTKITAFSDAKGNFQIILNQDISPVLVVSYLGYQTLEKNVSLDPGESITITLLEAQGLSGEVCIVKKPSLLQRIFRIF